MFLCYGFRKTVLGSDLVANAFRGSIQKHKIIFDIFLIYFLFHHLSFRKTEGGLILAYPQRIIKLFIIFIQRWFHLWSFYSVQNVSYSFTCIKIYQNLKPMNYLKIVMVTSPGFFFKEANFF